MSAGVAALVGFALAAGLALLATPVAMRVAQRTGFLDRPRGYRKHTSPTPFLGGAAVVLAAVLAAAVAGALHGKLLVVLVCTAGMWVLGTLDDRFAVPPLWRVLFAAGAAVWLYAVGLGWNTSIGPLNPVVTVVWVVGLINAFNLMDNMDGACSSVAATASAGVGVLALLEHHAALAVFSFALSGACVGFLRWNLAGPAKIFLGDGGSMPVGLLAATLAMSTSRHAPAGNAGILVGAMLVGVPILDVALVSVSRTRRGVSLLTGGRDHLTHRIQRSARTPRTVAGTLIVVQALLCALALAGYELGEGAVFGIAFAACVAGLAAVWVLDGPAWRPPGIAQRDDQGAAPRAAVPAVAGLDRD